MPKFGKNEVKNLAERKIKTLRLENGGEYAYKELITFCKEERIKREIIVPYNPGQNGVVERKNRIIEECIRAMLHDQDLPKFLWGEVTVVYLQNQSPRKILNNMTLEEAFTGNKPSVDHLQIFGCPIYIRIPKDKRNKLDPTSMKGIFVGYSASSNAYKIYIK